MTAWHKAAAAVATGCCVMLTGTSCAFQGVNALPLPGAVGRGSGATTYHVEVANVGRLESNSPVMIDDVVVGSVGKMTVKGWHAIVDVSVKPDVVVPVNAVAAVGQTSLLGSMHVELAPPPGEAARGRLAPGSTIPLNKSSTYPSTEQTLASLSLVVNAGGLGQIGDIIHDFNAVLSGRQGQIRDLLGRLDSFVGTLDQQRDNIIASIQGLNRLADILAGQRDVLTDALRKLPPALDVLIRERPRLIEALNRLRVFSDTATGVVNDTEADLVKNLENLEPTIRALADVGPDLVTALAGAPIFPYTQVYIDRAYRGDYVNLFIIFDFTIPRLKRSLLMGTRWGEEGAQLVPAPGDPWYLNYSYDPLGAPFAVPPPDGAAPMGPAGSPPTAAAPGIGSPVSPAVSPPELAPLDEGGR